MKENLKRKRLQRIDPAWVDAFSTSLHLRD